MHECISIIDLRMAMPWEGGSRHSGKDIELASYLKSGKNSLKDSRGGCGTHEKTTDQQFPGFSHFCINFWPVRIAILLSTDPQDGPAYHCFLLCWDLSWKPLYQRHFLVYAGDFI